MAPRSIWKGSIKLSLITIPVRLYPATRADVDVAFRQFHRVCKTPIQMKKWCPHCDVEVTKDDIVKGHETSKGRFVFVEDEEVAGVRPETSHTLVISDVMDASVVEPRYVERAYYLAPDSKDAGSAFAVIRTALEGKTAIGRLAMHGREYLAAVIPDGEAMVLYTLRTAGEVRARDDAADLEFAGARAKPEEVKLARQVLASLESDADLSTFTDNYETRLRELLKKKGAGAAVTEEAAPAGREKVVNLMDALRQSLASARSAKRAKAPASRKTARVIKHAPQTKRRKAS